MDETERQIRRKLRDDYLHYAEKCLKVRLKSGDILPLKLNKAQRYLHEQVETQRRATGKVRAIIVKGRQQGCSTYIEGRFYWRVTHSFGLRAFILTHDNDATNNLFEMAQRFHDYCPAVIKQTVGASNAKELIFSGLDSGYKLGTAGNKAVGRSSTIQLLHGSEVAYWPNAEEHAKGILQAVPSEKNTEIFLESTANGIGNYFHQQWQMAEAKESDFIPIFLPWYWQEEYIRKSNNDFNPTDEEQELIQLYELTNDQLLWRRHKIIELSVGGSDGSYAFMQEYPCNSTEAFQFSGENAFILPLLAMQSRKSIADPYGPIIVGVDPARFGDDRTSIVYRRGRRAYNLLSYAKKDTMEVTGIVHRIIVEDKPDRVCIDIGGLGAGIYDRLCELGHRDKVIAVNGGATPLDQKKYYNKRAEMWGLMKEWLVDVPCQIPDEDSLHADLCGILYKFDSNSRLQMEKKEDMKKRGVRSPDEADALALTFACPDASLVETRQKQYGTIGRELLSSFNKLDRLKKAAYK